MNFNEHSSMDFASRPYCFFVTICDGMKRQNGSMGKITKGSERNMKIAFLNLCHCDPEVVERVANKLTKNNNFDMYIHVDGKSDINPFQKRLSGNKQVYFITNRKKVFWGGYNAIEATFEMLRTALNSDKHYDYFVLLQNLDYPIRSNEKIEEFFEKNKGTEFIRGCKIARTKDWHYSRKYKILNERDDEFYITNKSKIRKYLRYMRLAIQSVTTIGFNGVIKEGNNAYDIYYGTAQWAITRDCAQHMISFEKTHPKFNERMKQIQFPDEEYFHTVVHNSDFKYHCVKFDEPEQRWLVNWRNIHYFEFPKEVTVFEEKDYEKIMKQDVLFIRKVKTGVSDLLMDKIDEVTGI